MQSQLYPPISLSKPKPSEIMRNCKLGQAFGRLSRDGKFCFIGALYTEIGGEPGFDGSLYYSMVDDLLLERFGIDWNIMDDIFLKNDRDKWSFTQIADYIADKYDL